MLIPDFYTLKEMNLTENTVSALILLNPDHKIYNGHFPEQPVVPGVVQLQIIKELMEKAVDEKLFLGEMGFAKFLKLITPEVNPEFYVQIDFKTQEQKITFSAKIEDNQTILTKVKGSYTVLK